jgi:hypothetical protein
MLGRLAAISTKHDNEIYRRIMLKTAVVLLLHSKQKVVCIICFLNTCPSFWLSAYNGLQFHQTPGTIAAKGVNAI